MAMPQGQGNLLTLLIFWGFFIVIMYLMIFRPQKKREKKTREMLNNLQVGTQVITIGGVMGKVINIKDDELTIETSVEKTQLKVKRWAIKEVEQPVEA